MIKKLMGNWFASNKLKNSPGARETQEETCIGPIHGILDDINAPLLANIAAVQVKGGKDNV